MQDPDVIKVETAEVLYSLKELVVETQLERQKSALAREKLDSLEIETVFKKAKVKRARKRKKAAAKVDKKQSRFLELLKLVHPPIPEENLKLLDEAVRSGSLGGLEDAVRKGLISQQQAGELWATNIGIAYVNPLESIVTPEALGIITEEIARKAVIIPLYVIENTLTFATDTPRDQKMLKRIEAIAGIPVSPVFALPSQIRDGLEIYYAKKEDIHSHIREFEKEHGFILENLSDADLKSVAEFKPVAKIVEAFLHWAIRERASDIHIEPMEGSCQIRFRVDGRLRQKLVISMGIYPAITSRLKVLTNVNIAESRFPQDGRFSIPLGTNKAEFRVSFIPVRHGTKTVIRILGSTGRSRMMTLDEMLVSQSILKPWRKVIHNPNGIIFVTGPTGSGKTTTLYASLQELNTPDVNIATIEDPIEIELPGLNQSQVNSNIDLNFALLLRSLLRQDPDIMLVGEIRDKETAKIAAEAALTGHLVFATLHTNNAIQAVTRLLEIGLEPYMVAPSINAVLAQRLAARLNEDFKESYRPPNEVLSRIFSDYEESDALFYRPQQGLKDGLRGFKGRIAIHEMALVSDEMRSLISNRAGTYELTQAAKNLGYRPLRFDGLKKALMGLTTIEEIERVTPIEWSS